LIVRATSVNELPFSIRQFGFLANHCRTAHLTAWRYSGQARFDSYAAHRTDPL